MSGGPGTKAGTLAFGGYDGNAVASTEGYDGTSWSTRPSLATARYDVRGTGSTTAALAIGGDGASIFANTEEFTGEIVLLDKKSLTSS